MSKAAFARALATTLIPGGSLANGVEAPAADAVIGATELLEWSEAETSAAAVAAIRESSGGSAGFIAASAENRREIVAAVEFRDPVAVQSLAAQLNILYYQHPAVLSAFGWRTAPPQPKGHIIRGTDPKRFEAVAAGGPIWRDPDR